MSSDVLARKLQGVYDCIDTHNFKGAIKLCQKKDIQHYDVTKALMAYSLISIKRTEEGLAIAREVKDRNPSEDSLLKTLGHCFRLAQMDAEVAECYESALAQKPNSEELAVELFKAYSRCADAKKMQATALKLYKTHADPKYVFWAVCSMLQQEGAPGTVLVLAERMLRRVLFETRVLSPPKRTAGAEETLLWVDVLTRQAELATVPEERIVKLNEALESLKEFGSHLERAVGSSSAVAMHNSIDLEYRIDSDVQFKSDPSIVELHPFMGRLRQIKVLHNILSTCFADNEVINGANGAKFGTRSDYLSQLIELYEGILFNYPDQWDVHEMWIALVVKHGSTDVIAHRERLFNLQSNYPQLRGPYLAEMYLLSSAHKAAVELTGWAPSPVSAATSSLASLPAQPFFFAEMSRLVCQYICMFGSKDCCFSDIRQYIDCLFRDTNADSACGDIVVAWLNHRRTEINREAWAEPPQRATLSSLNKLDQLLHYISPNHSTRALLLDRMALHAVSGSACVAVGSSGLEDRGLRAGDNLLLVCSAWLQDAIGAIDKAADGLGTVPLEIRHFFGNMLWAVLLKAGQLCSDHNYTFPLQALMGPMRAMALSEAGLSAYKSLDVKQIQIDSMTYLAIPPLLESGFYKEALMGMRCVIAFHKNARQETGEMLCKACKMANYDKAIEIKNFGTRCARSMQLGLAQSEFPLLDIAENKHTRADAVAYLKLHSAGFLDESAPDVMRMTREESDKYYVENMDYDVLPPSCALQALQQKVQQKNGFQREGYLRRLDVSRAATSLMLRLMQLDAPVDISACVMALRIATTHSGVPDKAFSGPNSLSSVCCGRAGFEDALWATVCDVAAVVTESMRLAVETDVVKDHQGIVHAELPDTGAVLLELRAAAVASIRSVRDALSADISLPQPSNISGVAPLSPAWIRMVSAFIRTVGSMCPLMLETLAEPLVHNSTKINLKPVVAAGSAATKSKKKGPKKPAEAPTAGCQTIETVVQDMVGELACLMAAVLEALRHAVSTSNEDNLKHFMSSWSPICSSDDSLNESVCNLSLLLNHSVSDSCMTEAVQASLNSVLLLARAAVVTDVAISQRATCTRLCDALEKKYNHFSDIFSVSRKI